MSHEWIESKHAKITRIWKWAYGGHATAFYDSANPNRLADMAYWNRLFLRIDSLRKRSSERQQGVSARPAG